MIAVAILHEGSAFEGHAVFIGLVQMGGGIEIALLLGLEACHGIGTQLHEGFWVGRCAADACGGDEVGVGGESLFGEALTARLDEPSILCVHIAHKEPGADAVGLEGCMEEFERVDVGEEGFPRLHVGGVSRGVHHAHGPDVLIAIVGHDGGAVHVGHLGAALQIEPQRHFRAVEGGLLDVGDGAGVVFPDERHLIGGIAQEITLEDDLCTLHVCHLAQGCLRTLEAAVLILKHFTTGLHMEHRMNFCHLTCREVRQFDSNARFFYVCCLVIHNWLQRYKIIVKREE